MNQVQLVGNLTKDPELRTTPNNISACSFTVAVQRKYKNANGGYDADFISCVAWRQTAEFVHKYFMKGNKIGLTGSLQTRSYDTQDGSKRYITEVVVENVEFVAPKSDSIAPATSPAPTYQQAPRTTAPAPAQQYEQQRLDTSGFTEVEDDDLPF